MEYGGSGVDFLYDAIVIEELARVRAHALMVSLHSGVCLPYIATFGTEAQKHKYLPGIIRGEILLGICMSEPHRPDPTCKTSVPQRYTTATLTC